MNKNIEQLNIGSKRLAWGRPEGAEQDHSWFKDDPEHYVPLCTKPNPREYHEVDWGEHGKKCQTCIIYHNEIMEDRARRRRQREADRRRQRYHDDPAFRKKLKDNNRRYLDRQKPSTQRMVAAFDAELEVFRRKWELEEEEPAT